MRKPRFRIGQRIGRGGVGEVFLAELADGRRAALKRLPADSSTDPDRAMMLMREADIVAELGHPNIVQIYGVEADEQGRLCLLMELIEGVNLAQLMHTGRVPLNVAMYIIRSVLQALEYAHEQAELVHRDVSPHNVLVAWDGMVKLSDFGIAKAAGSTPTMGFVCGKPGYISPEQAQGLRLDGRADLFAVGVMLYKLITNRHPLDGTPSEYFAQLANPEPIAAPSELCSDVPADVDVFVMKLLERDRTKRFATARHALDELPATNNGRSELAELLRIQREAGAFKVQVDPLAKTTPAPGATHRRGAVVLGAMGMTLILGAGLWLYPDRNPGHPAQAVKGDAEPHHLEVLRNDAHAEDLTPVPSPGPEVVDVPSRPIVRTRRRNRGAPATRAVPDNDQAPAEQTPERPWQESADETGSRPRPWQESKDEECARSNAGASCLVVW